MGFPWPWPPRRGRLRFAVDREERARSILVLTSLPASGDGSSVASPNPAGARTGRGLLCRWRNELARGLFRLQGRCSEAAVAGLLRLRRNLSVASPLLAAVRVGAVHDG